MARPERNRGLLGEVSSWLPPRIKRNVVFKLFSETFGKLAQFVLMATAARLLGSDGFGRYTFGLAIGLIAAPFSDFGLQLFAAREIARGPGGTERRIGNLILVKAALSVAVLIVLSAALFSLEGAGETKLVTFLVASAMVFSAYVEFFGYVFRGFQRLEYEAALTAVHRSLSLILGLLALFFGYGAVGLSWGVLCAALCSALIGYLMVRGRFVVPDLSPDGAIWREALREVAPIGLTIILSAAYFRIDVIFLEAMKGEAVVGLYSAAYKLLEPLMFLPAVLLAAVFPAFSQTRSADGMGLAALGRRTMALLLVLALPISSIAITLGHWIIPLVYGGDYLDSVRPFRILMVALPPIFINYALTHFLIALDRQKLNLIFSFLCLLLNVGLNSLLIPVLSAVGAAISTLATELFLFALCFWAVSRELRAVPRGPKRHCQKRNENRRGAEDAEDFLRRTVAPTLSGRPGTEPRRYSSSASLR